RDRILAINTFPVEAEKPVVSELLTRSDVLYLALWGDLPEEQLKEQAEKVKEDLRRLPSVSQVSVSGVRDYQISIEVSENRLREYGLSLNQVAERVRRECLNIPGGSVWTQGEEFKIRTMGRRYRGEEFRNLVVLTRPDGTVITLDRIAEIRDAFEDEPIFGMFNGKRAALVTVYKTDEEDALAISENIKTYVEAKKEELPPGLELTLWSDFSRLIRDRLDLLLGNGQVGFFLVFIILWFFMGLRLGFWVAMGIPVSLAGAMIFMAFTGQTINMISLFALIMTLGIIVDDAIVVGEAIYVQRLRGEPPFKAAVKGVLEVFWPVVGAVTTTIVAFLPLFYMSGIMGKFIAVLPVAVISALLVSLFESLYMLPAHLNHLPDLNPDPKKCTAFKRIILSFRKRIEGLEGWIVNRIYEPSVYFALRWRYVAFAGAIAVFLIMLGVVQGGLVKFILFPQADTDFLIARVEFPTGTPIEVTRSALIRMEDGLKKVDQRMETDTGEPMVQHVYSMVGGFSGYDIQKGSHLAEVKVELLPTERRGLYYKEINRLWEETVGAIEGALSLTYDTIEQGPPGKPIEIWFMGDDYDRLLSAAEILKERLRSLKGVYGVEDNHRPGKTELRIRLKPAARTLGLTLADVGMQMRYGWYGDEPVRIQRGLDDIRVKVRYPLEERRSLADLENIRIRTPLGAEVPFTSVADTTFEKGLTEIHRNNGKRLVTVMADVHTELANANEIMQD
ncbi:MAG: efflux RND transporter permease subunit, partial [Planctomycetes bacterium]|nr:efflux RND transporter permease subunit [Planctomycetota bacterium]